MESNLRNIFNKSSLGSLLLKKTKMKCFGIVTLLFLISNTLSGQSVVFDWVNTVGGTGADVTAGWIYKNQALAADKQGNVYNIGNIRAGELNTGLGNNKFNADIGNQYLAKFDSAGKFIWAKQFAGKKIDTDVIILDSLGNIYLGGYFEDTMDMNPGAAKNEIIAVGYTDMFIIKLDSLGNYRWGKHFMGGRGANSLTGLALDKQGNIIAVGDIQDVVYFDGSTGGTNTILNGNSSFILKLNNSGEFEWVKKFSPQKTHAITLDDWGNILTTGYYNGKQDFNPGSNPEDTFFITSNSVDAFVLKLNPEGEFIWARGFGGAGWDESLSITTDEAGSVSTTGHFSDTADFNPWGNSYELVVENNKFEPFFHKMDSSGNFVWAKQLRTQEYTYGGWGVFSGRGKASGIYFTGDIEGPTKYYSGKDTLSFEWQDGAYLIKLDTAGNLSWGKQLGANFNGAVLVSDNGDVFTAGHFNRPSVDFDPGPDTHTLNLLGSRDGFIHKLRFCNWSDTIVETKCKQFVFHNEIYTKSGIYVVANPEGCDSLSEFVLDLTIYNLDPVITTNENILGVNQPFNSYQWLQDGDLISGAIDSTYLVTKNGKYQVIVTNEDGCVDTSAVYEINSISGINNSSQASGLLIYPNPTDGTIHVQSKQGVNITITGIEGNVLKALKEPTKIDIHDLANGIYLLHISDLSGNVLKIGKVIKMNSGL